MCTYSRTVFSCNHQYWNFKVQDCRVHEEFRAGMVDRDCAYKQPHPIKTTRLDRKCEKCLRIEEILGATRGKLEEAREEFARKWKKVEEHQGDESVDQIEKKDGIEQMTEPETCQHGDGWIHAEDGVIKPCQMQEPEVHECPDEISTESEGPEMDNGEKEAELMAEAKESEINEQESTANKTHETTVSAPTTHRISQLKPPSQIRKPVTALPVPKTKKPQEPVAPAAKTPPKSRMPVPKPVSRTASPVTPSAGSKLPRFGARK